MKTLLTWCRSVLRCALPLVIIHFLSHALHAQIIFQQDFSAGGPVTNYVGSPPSIGQFSSISYSVPLVSDFLPLELDEQLTVGFNGTAQSNILNGKLQFTLNTAYRKYASPRAVDCCGGYFYDATESRVTLLRQSLGAPAPKILYVQFNVRIYNPYINTNSPSGGGTISFTAPSGQQLGDLNHVLGGTGDLLKFESPQLFFTNEVLVTIVLNHTGTNISYAAPNGTAESLGGLNYDYWINQTKVRNDTPSLSSPPLNFFGILVKSATSPVTLSAPGITGLPDDPGPATTFTFDNFIIRRDFPSPTQSPTLNIQRTSTNTFLLSWSSSFTGFALQQKTNLVSGTWTGVTNSVSVANNLNQVIVAPATGSRFFRLLSN